MALTEEQRASIQATYEHQGMPGPLYYAHLIESAVTAPLLEWIAQLEQAVRYESDLCQQALDSREQLEQQLAEERKDAERLRFALGDPDGKLTASQLNRLAHEVCQKAEKWDDWCGAQTSIETEMPQGWRFVLDCSPGDWSLDLVDPDGKHVQFDHDCDTTAQMIRSAIACAREKAGVLSNTEVMR